MRRDGARTEGPLEGEGGFTLPEMMVTIMVMIVVLFALYSIFDMSLRVFSFGNDKVEAVQNARVAMERMEREIRAAHPQNKAGSGGQPENGRVILSALSPAPRPEVTFGNDLNRDRVVQPGEVITYRSSGGALQRVLGGNAEVLAEPLRPDGLKFSYFEGDGTTPATDEADVAIVRIEVSVDVDGRVQALQTDVALRNRGV